MRIRTSVGQTPCFRSTYYQCQNVACGATFSGSVTIDYQLSPSGLEQPLMVLPVAPAVERMIDRPHRFGKQKARELGYGGNAAQIPQRDRKVDWNERTSAGNSPTTPSSVPTASTTT